jgi:hypothetical protein
MRGPVKFAASGNQIGPCAIVENQVMMTSPLCQFRREFETKKSGPFCGPGL